MTFRAVLAAVTVAGSVEGVAGTLASLQAQQDTRWQWCLVTAGDRALHEQVMAVVGPEARVLLVDAGSVPDVERLSAALSLVDAAYVCLLGPGDTLDGGTVGQVRELTELDAPRWMYTDEGMNFDGGMGRNIWFKPEFSPELLRSQPYPVRSAFLPLDVVVAVGGVSPRAGSAQWYDLVLRVLDRIGPPIHRTGPWYLRAPEPDGPLPPWVDGTGADRCRAVGEHCDRAGISLTEIAPVEIRGREIGQRLTRRLDGTPTVSIVIPTRGGSSPIYGFPRCHVVEMVESLWTSDRYPELELIVVYDESTPVEVLERLTEITDGEVVLQPFVGEFHYSRKCNEGALAASGEYLCFLNDDMKVITPGWLYELVSLLADPEVGAVGAKLVFADGTLQHVGHVYNGGVPGHLLFTHAGDSIEKAGIAQLTGERAGVTGACLLMRTGDFHSVGGFSELFPLNYNDVDLCLKIRDTGLRILYTPAAVLEHYESQTRTPRIDPSEVTRIERRWRTAMHSDPMINPLERMPMFPRPDVLQF